MAVSTSLISTFISFCITVLVVKADKCPAPLRLDVGTVRLGLAREVESYGIKLSLGGQFIAARPNPNKNETYVTTVEKLCDGVEMIPADCPANASEPISQFELEFGGFYSGALSRNFTSQATEDPLRKSNESVAVRDSLEIDGISIENFEFQTQFPTDVRISPAYLGLGRSSSFAESISESIQLPSRSWSFFGGWNGVNLEDGNKTSELHTKPGSLILGGHDSGITESAFTNFQMASNRPGNDCQTVVSVNGISWFGSPMVESPFLACVDPTRDDIEIPEYILNLILEAKPFYLGSTIKYEQGWWMLNEHQASYGLGFQMYRDRINGLRNSEGDASLQISIDRGLSIRIPDHQLFRRVWSDYQMSNMVHPNATARQTRGNWYMAPLSIPENNNRLPRLGLVFLSSAYLLVNPSNNTFGLAPITSAPKSRPTIIPLGTMGCYIPTAQIVGPIVGSIVVALVAGSVIFYSRKVVRKWLKSFFFSLPNLPEFLTTKKSKSKFAGNDAFLTLTPAGKSGSIFEPMSSSISELPTPRPATELPTGQLLVNQLQSSPIYHMADHFAEDKPTAKRTPAQEDAGGSILMFI